MWSEDLAVALLREAKKDKLQWIMKCFCTDIIYMTILIMSTNMTTEGEKKNLSGKCKHALNQKFPAFAHMGMRTGTNSPCFILGFRAGHSKIWDNTSASNFPNVRTFDSLAFKPIFSPFYQARRNPPHSPGFTDRAGFLSPHDPLQNKWSFFLGQIPALLRFLDLVHSLVFRYVYSRQCSHYEQWAI